MSDPATIPRPMTAEAFLPWAMAQPEGHRYELLDGDVVRMPAERAAHAEAKAAIFIALHDAIRTAGIPCRAYSDGFAVRIGQQTVFEPDALVRCGPRLEPATVVIDDPVIVVEVFSPSSAYLDANAKLVGYFQLASVQHYLTLDPRRRVIVHHAREGDSIRTRILSGGLLRLEPPGITVSLDGLFE